ncbi:MAG: excinuclease ABC subunit A, partial [Asgard group archaeon]|nr:excinuclease ABC subunit A [Asgard group archaeon]
GLGYRLELNQHTALNPNLSIVEGGILPWSVLGKNMQDWYLRLITAVGKVHGFSVTKPLSAVSPAMIEIILRGAGDETFDIQLPWSNKSSFHKFEGVMEQTEKRYNEADSDFIRKKLADFMIKAKCTGCAGSRLNIYGRNVFIGAESIANVTNMSIPEVKNWMMSLEVSEENQKIVQSIQKEILDRLSFLENVGLSYLTLSRTANTLSGGEAQRIRLATQIGSQLQGVLYVLDEPSIGLHPRDSQKLINVLHEMRDLGNTVIVIEHDIDTIKAADHLIELGPGPGIFGGEIVIQGTIEDIMKHKESVTGQYLSGIKTIAIPPKRRESNGHSLVIKGAKENNLQNIDVKIPLGNFVCITGVSGSGKSSLIHEILYKKLYSVFRDKRIIPGNHTNIEGIEYLEDIRNIDQTPIGRSARSNPATYIGFYDKIRQLYTELPESKARGYNVGQFSFNASTGGRCPECAGWGRIITPLQFMADIESICPVCKGSRFRKEILEIKYRNKTIADVLDMSVEEALEFFKNDDYLVTKLQVMKDLGLGYLKIGQSSSTISGGEAQRIKLAQELGKIKRRSNNLYLLDEPTTGLHLADIQRLLDIINRLVDEGNTVIIIEHNLDVIKTADYVIDLGPDGGKFGGEIIAEGTPEEIAKVSNSYTGKYLKKLLN